MSYQIKGFIEQSYLDWPNEISSVLFLAKCNFICLYCHNLNLVLRYDDMPTLLFADIKQKLIDNYGWVNHITITGGEPLVNDDLEELLLELKELKFKIKLDTNGSFPHRLYDLIDKKLIDYVSVDFKVPFNGIFYEKLINVYRHSDLNSDYINELINDSLYILKYSNIDFEIRTTIVPNIHTKEILLKMKEQLGNDLIKFWKLQNYSNLSKVNLFCKLQKPYTKEEFDDLKNFILWGEYKYD